MLKVCLPTPRNSTIFWTQIGIHCLWWFGQFVPHIGPVLGILVFHSFRMAILAGCMGVSLLQPCGVTPFWLARSECVQGIIMFTYVRQANEHVCRPKMSWHYKNVICQPRPKWVSLKLVWEHGNINPIRMAPMEWSPALWTPYDAPSSQGLDITASPMAHRSAA